MRIEIILKQCCAEPLLAPLSLGWFVSHEPIATFWFDSFAVSSSGWRRRPIVSLFVFCLVFFGKRRHIMTCRARWQENVITFLACFSRFLFFIFFVFLAGPCWSFSWFLASLLARSPSGMYPSTKVRYNNNNNRDVSIRITHKSGEYQRIRVAFYNTC